VIHAKHALLASGWARDVRLSTSDGWISRIETGVRAIASDSQVDTLLPALSNLHCHSFQRAMAGMTEYRRAGLAALAFMEMQEAGYAAVGEFHYVHHQKNGAPYANIAVFIWRGR